MRIELNEVASILKANDNYLILTHRNPDGDTLGSGFGLMHALRQMGKSAKVLCCDEIPAKYSYLYSDGDVGDVDGAYVIAVDVADEKLLGEGVYEKYSGKVKLCIDHHISNKEYAEKLYLRDCSAVCEIIYDLLVMLGIKKDAQIADCLYTGISTDTGCYKFSNVTARPHEITAKLMAIGANTVEINKLMFESKTRGYYMLESAALSTLEYYFDGMCAVMTITQKMLNDSGTRESDCDGISGIPRKIEGVLVGATLRERPDGTFKVSLRSHAPVDCSKICLKLGGGGHARAAGCELSVENIERDKQLLLDTIKEELDRDDRIYTAQ